MKDLFEIFMNARAAFEREMNQQTAKAANRAFRNYVNERDKKSKI
jgi:hypothetical protein